MLEDIIHSLEKLIEANYQYTRSSLPNLEHRELVSRGDLYKGFTGKSLDKPKRSRDSDKKRKPKKH